MDKAELAGGIVIGPSNKIVLVEQNNSSNRWSFPKGHVEEGETLLQAAIREVQEETGLKKLLTIKEIGEFERAGGNSLEIKRIHMFLFETSETELKPDDPSSTEDDDNAEWFTINEAITLLNKVDGGFLTDYQFLLT